MCMSRNPRFSVSEDLLDSPTPTFHKPVCLVIISRMNINDHSSTQSRIAKRRNSQFGLYFATLFHVSTFMVSEQAIIGIEYTVTVISR